MLSALGGTSLACSLLKEFPSFLDNIKIKVWKIISLETYLKIAVIKEYILNLNLELSYDFVFGVYLSMNYW